MKNALVLDNISEVPKYEGTVQVTGSLQGNGVRCAVVVSRFNMALTTALADSAVRSLLDHGVKASDITVAWVPGAYEIPTVACELARKGTFDAIVALGVVIQGETQHAQLINQHIALSLGRLSLDYALTVIYEVISAQSIEQAAERCTGEGSRGRYAALAALEMIETLKHIRN